MNCRVEKFLLLFVLIVFGGVTKAATSVVYLDDPKADVELLFSAYSGNNVDLNFYMQYSKNTNRNVFGANPFERQRELERLKPIAETRKNELKSASVVAFVSNGFGGPSLASYNFNSKGFPVDFSQALKGGDFRNYSASFKVDNVVPGFYMPIVDQRLAESIENRRNIGGGLRQTIEFLKVRSAVVNQSGSKVITVSRIGFIIFDSNGKTLARMADDKIASPEEINLIKETVRFAK